MQTNNNKHPKAVEQRPTLSFPTADIHSFIQHRCVCYLFAESSFNEKKTEKVGTTALPKRGGTFRGGKGGVMWPRRRRTLLSSHSASEDAFGDGQVYMDDEFPLDTRKSRAFRKRPTTYTLEQQLLWDGSIHELRQR